MKLLDVFNAAKAANATKVFVNSADVKILLQFPPIPAFQAPIAQKLKSGLGKGGGLWWYEDASIPVGQFRVE